MRVINLTDTKTTPITQDEQVCHVLGSLYALSDAAIDDASRRRNRDARHRRIVNDRTRIVWKRTWKDDVVKKKEQHAPLDTTAMNTHAQEEK